MEKTWNPEQRVKMTNEGTKTIWKNEEEKTRLETSKEDKPR